MVDIRKAGRECHLGVRFLGCDPLLLGRKRVVKSLHGGELSLDADSVVHVRAGVDVVMW